MLGNSDSLSQDRSVSLRRDSAPVSPAPGRKLKVLLVSQAHPELKRGGAQQTCYELFLGLSAEPDVEAFFLAAAEPGAYPGLAKPGARITGFDGRKNEFLYLAAHYDTIWHRTTSRRHVEA